MARDWIKLQTGMLGHVGTMRLSDRAFRLWVVLLLMAGQRDEDGTVGPIADVAFYLRWNDDELSEALTELNGRAVVADGVVAVRDWTEWQPKIDRTNAERQARWRARNAASTGDGVTPLRNGVTNDATRAREEEPEAEEEPKEKKGKTTADKSAWGCVAEWLAGRVGASAVYRKNGMPYAHVKDLFGEVGAACEHDAGRAVPMLDRWHAASTADGTWRYVTAKNAHEKFAKWYADQRAVSQTWTAVDLDDA